jgi:hypothetical protein
MSAAKLKRTQDIDNVRAHIKDRIAEKFGTLSAYADKNGVSLQYVSMVLSGNKAVPAWMLASFKINHVVQEYWEGK